jgi:hypothetical protein
VPQAAELFEIVVLRPTYIGYAVLLGLAVPAISSVFSAIMKALKLLPKW